jgi:hypothetical protein
VPGLKWNDDLARGAQAWADHLSATGQFEHSPNVPGKPLEGENIWGGTPGAFLPESMVTLGRREEILRLRNLPGKQFHRPAAGRSPLHPVDMGPLGEVGCGLSSLGREEILVCRYSEPGNVRGRDPFAGPKAPAPRRAYSDFNVPLASSAARRPGFSSAATTAFAPAAAGPAH